MIDELCYIYIEREREREEKKSLVISIPTKSVETGLPTKQRSSRRFPVVNVLTESTELELGTNPPPFALPDVKTGEMVSLEDFEGHQVRQVVLHMSLLRVLVTVA